MMSPTMPPTVSSSLTGAQTPADVNRHNDLDYMSLPLPNQDSGGDTIGRIAGPKGTMLVDAAGWICAADREATTWICERLNISATGAWHLTDIAAGTGLEEKLERLFAGEEQRTVVASLPNGKGSRAESSIRWTLITGSIGAHALLEIAPHSQLVSYSTLDALTQLPDRRAIFALIDQWRDAAASTPPRFALLFVDFNEFKSLNDHYGHAVGDIVLRTLADRLQNSIRDGDLAARYGGDEFVLLIRGVMSPAEVEPVLTRLAAAIQQPLCVNGLTLQFTATIGWSAPPSGDWTTESLIVAADADMYARKRAMLR